MSIPISSLRRILEFRREPIPKEGGDGFETYLRKLKTLHDAVVALGDGMDGQPWFRLHADLVRSGIWAKLKPCSRAVYVTLAALTDRRKRTTIAGVALVARLSGLSEARTMFAYKELREFGLIWRRRIALNGYRPYSTGLTNPGRWAAEGARSK